MKSMKIIRKAMKVNENSDNGKKSIHLQRMVTDIQCMSDASQAWKDNYVWIRLQRVDHDMMVNNLKTYKMKTWRSSSEDVRTNAQALNNVIPYRREQQLFIFE